MDNVFIERLWRSLKHECVYLHAFETGSELRAGVAEWIGYYNGRRPHSTLALDRLRRSLLRRRIARAMAHARRGIRGRWDGDGETGGLTETRTKLNRAAKPSEGWGPPQVSTAFSHEPEVGVKWNVHRGWRASHAFTLGCLWVA